MRQLTQYEQNELLKSFPNVELSYETIIHNKVHKFDSVLAIPEGDKYFAWFTVFEKQNVCILMEISDNKKICGLEIVHCCFDYHLSFCTIFYGTIFTYNKQRFFTIEDVMYYKGKNVASYKFMDKLKIYKAVFLREIKQTAYTRSSIILGLPLMKNTLPEIAKMIPTLPYKIKYLQYRENSKQQGNHRFNALYSTEDLYQHDDNHKSDDSTKQPVIKQTNSTLQSSNTKQSSNSSNSNNNRSRENMSRRVFKVRPDIKNDIYHLFTYCTTMTHSSTEEAENYYDVAYIPDYKTSVMMNKLFRNIKENANLDALEESDDEEEFENDREDKFVYLERTYDMICQYNNKFKKWTPIEVAKNDNAKNVTTPKQIRLEKNKH